MLQANSRRYEFKLRCPAHQFAQVQAWVRLHSAHWRVTYPSRYVNNVYFDTVDHQCLNDNLGGVGRRQKLRLRWYGCDLDTIAEAHLELKCKEGSVGWKETSPLKLPAEGDHRVLDLAHQSWPELCRVVRNCTGARENLWLENLSCPVLINRYHRTYYATPDQTIRLTLDTKLQVFDQRFSARPNLHLPSAIADYVIVEFKADREHYARLVNLLEKFPIRIGRNSKYVQGVLAAPGFHGVGPL